MYVIYYASATLAWYYWNSRQGKGPFQSSKWPFKTFDQAIDLRQTMPGKQHIRIIYLLPTSHKSLNHTDFREILAILLNACKLMPRKDDHYFEGLSLSFHIPKTAGFSLWALWDVRDPPTRLPPSPNCRLNWVFFATTQNHIATFVEQPFHYFNWEALFQPEPNRI